MEGYFARLFIFLMQLVQMSRRRPSTLAYWRFGFLRDQFTGLYLPRSFRRAPAMMEPFPQSAHCFMGVITDTGPVYLNRGKVQGRPGVGQMGKVDAISAILSLSRAMRIRHELLP